jgi:cytochrome b subunit of formate dehydrogenase
MLPARADLAELIARVRHYIGRGPAPHGVRLGYIEKSEYWAFMWGAVLMAGTGFLLWFENLSLFWLPSWVLHAATAVHFYEAVLATLAILVWHVYWVIFDPLVYPMDATWWTGRSPASRAAERGELRSEAGTEDAASWRGRQP